MAARKSKNTLPAKKRPETSVKAPPATVKSKEIVSDSDVSEYEPPVRPPKKTQSSQRQSKSTAKPTIATKTIGENGGRIEQQSESSPASSKAETKKSEEEDSTEEDDGSSSQEDENSDESDSEEAASSSTSHSPSQEAPNAPTQKSSVTIRTNRTSYEVAPANGVKRKAEKGLEKGDDEADEDDDDEGDEEEEEEEEDGGDDDTEDSESGDEDEESGSTSAGSTESPAKPSEENLPVPASHLRRPLRTYEPPTGFAKSRISHGPSSEIPRLLQASNLEGKQIWHITAPAMLSLDSLRDIAEQSLRNNSTIFSHSDTDYGLLQDPRQKDAVLLLPSSDENRYCSSQAPVSAIYHVSQIVNLSILEPAHIPPGASSTEMNTSCHQQPEGLRMRFHAFGVSSGSDSDGLVGKKPSKGKSASLSVPSPPPVFRHPPAADQPSTPKKKKKHKDGASQSASELSSVTKAKDLSTSQHSSQTNGANVKNIDSTQTKLNTSEEQAHLKKRKRKDDTVENQLESRSTIKSKKVSIPPPIAQVSESEDIDVDSLPKLGSQLKSSKSPKAAGESKEPKLKISDNSLKQKPRKSTPTSNSTIESTKVPPPTSDTMDTDKAPSAIKSPQAHVRSSPKLQDSLAPTTSTSKETPEERAKRKEERRRQKALKKKQQQEKLLFASLSSSNGNAPLASSQNLESSSPALPLSEYSARLNSAEKTKTGGEIWSQSTTGGLSSPSAKKKKKVRWTDVGSG